MTLKNLIEAACHYKWTEERMAVHSAKYLKFGRDYVDNTKTQIEVARKRREEAKTKLLQLALQLAEEWEADNVD